MGEHEQTLVLRGKAEQGRPDEWALCQVKGLLRFLLCDALRLGLPLCLRDMSSVEHGKRNGKRGRNHLSQLFIHDGKGGAQALVALNDLIEARFQSLRLTCPLHAQEQRRYRMALLWIPLVQEPEALLRERGWKSFYMLL